jgi:hypothetical protein
MPTLNRQGLEEEFDIPAETEVVEPEIVDEGPDPFELEWEEETSDIQALRDNVERANEVLDMVKEEMENGNFSARLVEVAGQIINSITTASSKLIDNSNYNKYLDIRKKLALLKEKEVQIKSYKIDRPKNQNLIIASREDVLKLLENKGNESDSEKESDDSK